MNIGKFLPIGSIVKVEDIPDELMIIGYYGTIENEDGIASRDYIACNAKEGYQFGNNIIFNKESIENVLFIGYKNDKTIRFLKVFDNINRKLRTSANAEEFENKMVHDFLNMKTSSKVSKKHKSILNEKKEGSKNE